MVDTRDLTLALFFENDRHLWEFSYFSTYLYVWEKILTKMSLLKFVMKV
jgi:hypothetical protein